MPKFAFRAYDSGGRVERGEIDAETQRAALDRLARRGLYPFDIGPEAKAGGSLASNWQRELFVPRSISLAAQATLARELATLLKAGLAVDEALRIIALQPRLGRSMRQLVEAVEADVLGGASLSQALAARERAIPEYFWRLVSAAEASGALPSVLEELSAYLDHSVRIRKQLITAMVYPMVLVAAAIISLTIILVVMVPAIVPLFEDAGAKPPFILAAFASVSRWVSANWPILLFVAATLGFALVWVARDQRVREAWHRAKLRIPIIGGHVQRDSTARFGRTLAMLLRNGVPMLDALETTVGVVRNRTYGAAIRHARDEVNRGQSLVGSLSETGLFPPLALRLMSIGEHSGQLAEMMGRLAGIYEHDQRQQLERLVAFVAPAITIAIGGLVGFLVITIFGAIVGLNEAVLR